MDWKQPEGLRRHWTLEELDAEILFLQLPVNAAQGRVGDDVYDLRDSGLLRKRRTLLRDGVEVACLEEKAAGAGGTLRCGDAEYTWKPTNLMNTVWVLEDPTGGTLLRCTHKPGLAKTARLEFSPDATGDPGVLLLLTWYAAVL